MEFLRQDGQHAEQRGTLKRASERSENLVCRQRGGADNQHGRCERELSGHERERCIARSSAQNIKQPAEQVHWQIVQRAPTQCLLKQL